MFVRTSTITGDPAKADEGTRFYSEQMIPAVKEEPGFLGALLLTDRATGKSLGLTFWETQDALQASEEAADKWRAQGASQANASTAPVVERFEVVYYGVPEPSAAK
jgi:heme-degrading monooxygenase HmoA